jgi:hypothetical protein
LNQEKIINLEVFRLEHFYIRSISTFLIVLFIAVLIAYHDLQKIVSKS